MADVSDAVNALGAAIGAILYPNGTETYISSVADIAVTIRAGWPAPQDLTQKIADGEAFVSLYPSKVGKVTTSYSTDWLESARPNATITVAVDEAAGTITFGGAAASIHNIGVLVDGKGYAHPVAVADTGASIASAVCLLIAADRPATVSGSVITVPDARRLVARVGVVGTALKEVRKQVRDISVGIWAPGPTSRDAIAKAIDPVLSDTPFLTMADGTAARLRYHNDITNDFDQRQGIYRRDLIYSVEYATTRQMEASELVLSVTDYLKEPEMLPLATTYG